MRAKATNETVLGAIRELIGGGDPDPSLDDIVALIGGSKSTVQKIVAANLGVIEEIREQALPMPTSVRDLYRNTALALWSGAEREARLKLRDEADQFARLNQSLQEHLNNQIEVNLVLASAVGDRDAEISSLRAELQTSHHVSGNLKSLADDLRHQLDRALAANAARDDLLTTLRVLGVGGVAVAAPTDRSDTEGEQTETAAASQPFDAEFILVSSKNQSVFEDRIDAIVVKGEGFFQGPKEYDPFAGDQLDLEDHLAAAPTIKVQSAAEMGEDVSAERVVCAAASSNTYLIATGRGDLLGDD